MTVRMLTPKDTYTFDYPEAVEYANEQIRVLWTAEEINVSKDVQDLRVNMTEAEKHGVVTTLKLFTIYELLVGNEYWLGRVKNTFPRPDIELMATTFGYVELGVHAQFYNKLNEALLLNTDEFYSSYVEDETLKSRIDFVNAAADDDDILYSLGVFSMLEGAVLYSSFAFLKHFQAQGKNKLMNVCRGINFSVRDECVTSDTEIMTPSGWKRMDEVSTDDKVAQYNPETKAISFVNPSRVVLYDVDEELVEFSGEKNAISQVVTKNHRMPRRHSWKDEVNFVDADSVKYNNANFIPVSGMATGRKTKLTAMDKFAVAVQADGHISDRYTGEKCGTRPIDFTVKKLRKKSRLEEIFNELGFSYKKHKKGYIVNVPVEVFDDYGDLKSFDWIDLSTISYNWAHQFIEEISQWDGHVPSGKNSGKYIYYSSINEENVSKVQAVAALCKKFATKTVQVDNRKEEYSDVHRLYIHDVSEKRGGSITKNYRHYKGKVGCVTVPTGAFVIRHNDRVSVTGNCLHSEAGAWLYRTLLKEKNIDVEERKLVEEKIIEAAKHVYDHECRIIEMIYERGEIDGLDQEELKEFVRSRINLCLKNLGIEEVFEVNENPVANWFYKNINNLQFGDFFTGTGSEYNRNWNEDGFSW